MVLSAGYGQALWSMWEGTQGGQQCEPRHE